MKQKCLQRHQGRGGCLSATQSSYQESWHNGYATAAAAKSLQSCPTLCDPRDGSPPGSPIPGILQARTLEWVAISFSSASKWKVKVKSLSCVRFLATPWTAAYQSPPSMEFSRQEYVLVSGIQQSDCYMYTHYFSYSFPIQVFTKYWVEFPVLYSRSLLVSILHTVMCVFDDNFVRGMRGLPLTQTSKTVKKYPWMLL